jgi:transcription initiation factor TFIIB
MSSLDRIVKCRECDGTDDLTAEPNVVEDVHSGDMVCRKCGLVIEPIIDQRTEWRTFANEDGDDPSRVGGPSDPFLDSLPLNVSISRRDGGSGMSRELNRAQMKAQTLSNADKALLDAFRQIENFCNRSQLPQTITDAAKRVYKKNEKNMRGKSSEIIIAAAIYMACRIENVPRTMKEICALTTVSKRDIGKCVRKMSETNKEKIGVIKANDFVARFCSNLDLGMKVQKAALLLIEKAKEKSLVASKSPVSIAAAAIFMVSQLSDTPKSQKDVAVVAGVAEPTINNAYKDFYQFRQEIVPTDGSLTKGVDHLPPP